MEFRCKFDGKGLNRVESREWESETEVGDQTGEQYSRMGPTKEV